jgi:ubiquinone/menaquinone biosynthesis C-methylase UbiE
MASALRSRGLSREDGKGILVDCCCGTGGLLRHLAETTQGPLTLGVDLDAFALAEASRGLASGSLLIRGDVLHLPLITASADGAFISHALHVLPPRARLPVLREMARIVRPEGLLVIADYDPDGSATPTTRFLLFLIERLAGGDHYRNYRTYMREGGVPALLKSAGLEARDKTPVHRGGGAIWVCAVSQRIACHSDRTRPPGAA